MYRELLHQSYAPQGGSSSVSVGHGGQTKRTRGGIEASSREGRLIPLTKGLTTKGRNITLYFANEILACPRSSGG